MKIKLIYLSLVVLLIAGVSSANAQADVEDLNSALGFDNTVSDVPESPIHFLIGIMAMIGSFIGYTKLKANK